MSARDTIVEWKCGRCRERGKFANLPDTTLKQIRDAVTRGHERRSLACHDRRGVTKVAVIINGKTLSFASIEGLLRVRGESDRVESPQRDDQSSGNTVALTETPAPSTAK